MILASRTLQMVVRNEISLGTT